MAIVSLPLHVREKRAFKSNRVLGEHSNAPDQQVKPADIVRRRYFDLCCAQNTFPISSLSDCHISKDCQLASQIIGGTSAVTAGQRTNKLKLSSSDNR